MTIAQAKSEIMQIYGMLSPDKQRAIDTLVKIEPCERVIVKRSDGGELEAIYDVSRELLILSYVTSELARDLGWTWETISEDKK